MDESNVSAIVRSVSSSLHHELQNRLETREILARMEEAGEETGGVTLCVLTLPETDGRAVTAAVSEYIGARRRAVLLCAGLLVRLHESVTVQFRDFLGRFGFCLGVGLFPELGGGWKRERPCEEKPSNEERNVQVAMGTAFHRTALVFCV